MSKLVFVCVCVCVGVCVCYTVQKDATAYFEIRVSSWEMRNSVGMTTWSNTVKSAHMPKVEHSSVRVRCILSMLSPAQAVQSRNKRDNTSEMVK